MDRSRLENSVRKRKKVGVHTQVKIIFGSSNDAIQHTSFDSINNYLYYVTTESRVSLSCEKKGRKVVDGVQAKR